MPSYLRRSFVFLILATVVCAETNRSWDVLVQSLQPGKTVVVNRMSSDKKVEGKLLALDADSITVQRKGQLEVVPKADVLRVRIANIRRRNTLLGMAIGAAAGAVLGGLSDRYRGQSAAAGALLGVGFGALGGGVIPIGKPLYEAPKPPKSSAKPAQTPVK